jgi:Tol biopolymer transport system component
MSAREPTKVKFFLIRLLGRCGIVLAIVVIAACGGGGSSPAAGNPTTGNPATGNTIPVTVAITYQPAMVTEADDVPVEMVFDISLDQAAANDIALDVSTVDGDAVANRDYRLRSDTLLIPAGDTDAQVVIDVIPDQFIEADESFELLLDSSSTDVASITDRVTATIVDNDIGKSQSVIYRRRAGGTQDDLYVVNEDGTANTVLANSALSEGYTGTTVNGRIIFSRDGDFYSVLADGSGEVQLTNTSNGKYYAKLTVNGRLVYSERQFPLTQEDVFSVNDDGSDLVALANTPDDEDVQAVTADGHVIYQHHNSGQYDLRMVSDQGGQAFWPLADDLTESEFYAGMTPGGRIIYTSQLLGSQADLYSVLQDGSDPRLLADDSMVDDDFVAALNGERVLFRREPTPGDHNLYSVLSDGTAQVTLADKIGSEWYESSTTDNRVIFRHYDGVQTDLHIIDANGNNPLPLATTADDEYLASSGSVLDDGRVVFVRTSNGQMDLYIINPDGSGELRLTDTPNEDEFLPFVGGIVSGRIVFHRESLLPVSQGGSGSALVSLQPDGSDEVVLTSGDISIDVFGATKSGRMIYQVGEGGVSSDVFSVNADGSDPAVLADSAELEFFVDIVL